MKGEYVYMIEKKERNCKPSMYEIEIRVDSVILLDEIPRFVMEHIKFTITLPV
jgi:hypothetical protein